VLGPKLALFEQQPVDALPDVVVFHGLTLRPCKGQAAARMSPWRAEHS
jgi:hypothetical protein